MRLALCIALLASQAHADPRLERQPDALPVDHIYAGGWEHFVGGGVAVFDCNNDALPDLFMAGGENPARFFVNASRPERLEFQSHDIGLDLRSVTGAYPIDIDSDGLVDLVVLRAGPNLLLRGMGNCAYTDASEAWGFERGVDWSTAFSATWEAGRVWPTLAVGNYVDREDSEGPFGACDDNLLYRPDGASFSDPAKLSPGYCALSMLFSDRGRAGPADLRISNDRHYYVRDGHEQLLRMDGLRWMDEDDGWRNISIWGMGIASRDITGDALPEVVLTSMGDQLMQIARPDGGYDAAPYEIGTYAQRPFVGDDGRPSTGWHAEFGDINNDGNDDLFIAKGNVDQMPSNAIQDPNNLLVQGEDGRFVERGTEAGVASTARSRGAALADFNLDGRLDLVVVNRRAPAEIYLNTSAGTGNWLTVFPQQKGHNVFAIGAWIELRANGRTVLREITIGGGHAGGQLGPQHFGLGAAENAVIRIRWPDGDWSDPVTLWAGGHHAVWRDGTGLRVASD